MLFVFIFAIRFLANTISVEMFQALEFIPLLAIFFIFNINPMSRKKRKAKRPSRAEDCGVLKLMSKIQ